MPATVERNNYTTEIGIRYSITDRALMTQGREDVHNILITVQRDLERQTNNILDEIYRELVAMGHPGTNRDATPQRGVGAIPDERVQRETTRHVDYTPGMQLRPGDVVRVEAAAATTDATATVNWYESSDKYWGTSEPKKKRKATAKSLINKTRREMEGTNDAGCTTGGDYPNTETGREPSTGHGILNSIGLGSRIG